MTFGEPAEKLPDKFKAQLQPEDEIVFYTRALKLNDRTQGGTCHIVVTQDRVVAMRGNFLRMDTVHLPFRQISAVRGTSRIGFASVAIDAQDTTTTFGAMGEGAARELAGVSRSRLGEPTTARQAGTEKSLGDQLAELAGLHEAGVLTDDEFAAAKARLIDGG